MYDFIDTTDAGGGNSRPAEALNLNGSYLEDLVPGYRTLYVSGREALAPNLEMLEVGSRDGTILSRHRYPERIIRVGYQLLTDSPEDFREAYNKLGGILNTTEATLIFDDEPDKYFTGTPSALGDVEPGRCSVKGEIEFTCCDPFKYSIDVIEVDPEQDGSFIIDYAGTYKSYPELQTTFYSETDISPDGSSDQTLTGAGDCGFVSWFNQDEKVIYLGDEEDDGQTFPASQTLVNTSFAQSSSWGSVAQNKWAVNDSSIQVPDTHTKSGTITVKHDRPSTAQGTYYLTANSFGSSTNNYHGPSVTRTIPADALGEVGAKDFTVQCNLRMCIGNEKGNTRQRGSFTLRLTDSTGKTVVGVNVAKYHINSKGKVSLIVNGATAKTIDVDLSYNNPYFGQDTSKQIAKKTIMITKQGGNVSFNVAGITASFSNNAITNTVVKKATLHFEETYSKEPMAYLGVSYFKFVKNNCTTYQDVPNKFSASDVVVADCRSAEVYLNDIPVPDLGALGNDWESFCLSPGINQIGTAYSEWVASQYAPTFKIRYREVYL